MKIERDRLVADVRLVLNQNQVEDEVDGIGLDHDTLELDDLISAQLLVGARYLLLNCPLRMVAGGGVKDMLAQSVATDKAPMVPDDFAEPGDVEINPGEFVPDDSYVPPHFGGGGLSPSLPVVNASYADKDGRFVALLPDDYLRLTLAKMADWKVPVRIASLDTDELRRIVNSKWTGVRPNVNRPVAIEEQNSDGAPVIALYGSGPMAKVEQLQYLPIPAWEDDALDLPEMMRDAVTYYTAGLVAQLLLMPQAGTLMGMGVTLSGIPAYQQAQEETNYNKKQKQSKN